MKVGIYEVGFEGRYFGVGIYGEVVISPAPQRPPCVPVPYERVIRDAQLLRLQTQKAPLQKACNCKKFAFVDWLMNPYEKV